MTERYNGWTNYETWCAALWMDQEGDHWRERAEEAVREYVDYDEARYQLSEEMSSFYDEFMPTVSGMYADLLGAAMSSINWSEISKHYLDDVEIADIDEIEE